MIPAKCERDFHRLTESVYKHAITTTSTNRETFHEETN